MSQHLNSCVHRALQKAKDMSYMVNQAYIARQGWLSNRSCTSSKLTLSPELRLSGKQIKKRLLDSTICIQRAGRQLLHAKAHVRHHEECRIAAALGGSAGHLYLGGLAGPGSLAADIVETLSKRGTYSPSAAAATFARRWKLLRAFFLLKRARFYAPSRSRRHR